MARNKTQKPLTEAPPEPDSSDETTSSTEEAVEEEEEEEVSASTASSEEEDDDEEENPSTPPPPSAKKLPSTTTTATISAKRPVTEDDSDDDEPPLQKLKPAATAAVVNASSSKPRSKSTVAGLAAEKRPSESDLKVSSKKPRKEKSGSGSGSGSVLVSTPVVVQEEGSKKLFQRVFSEDDEIEILKGMIEYRAKRGADPMYEIDDFYGFIKKSLHVDVNKGQIVDKVRRLRKKFYNAKKKKLTNPHEIQAFELSKKIWESNAGEDADDEKIGNGVVAVENHGNNTNSNSNLGSKSSAKARVLKIKSGGNVAAVEDQKNNNNSKEVEVGEKGGKVTEVEEKAMDFEIGEAVSWEKLRKKGLRLMGAKARAEIEGMWEKVAVKQAEAKMLRLETEQEETRRIMEALRSGKH